LGVNTKILKKLALPYILENVFPLPLTSTLTFEWTIGSIYSARVNPEMTVGITATTLEGIWRSLGNFWKKRKIFKNIVKIY
jgi:hypothetical protein